MLKQLNIQILHQLIGLLEQINITIYTKSLSPLHHNSVGQHIRHITEFYICLINGYETKVVNYDNRERNFKIELDIDFTIDIIKHIQQRLTEEFSDQSISLISKFGTDSSIAVNSSFDRELNYLIEHTIHHFAIIKIGLNEVFPEVELPENFGIAHSTIQFRESLK